MKDENTCCLVCKQKEIKLDNFNGFKVNLNGLKLPKEDELFCEYCLKIVEQKYQKYKHSISEKRNKEDQSIVIKDYWEEMKRKSINRYPDERENDENKRVALWMIFTLLTFLILLQFIYFYLI